MMKPLLAFAVLAAGCAPRVIEVRCVAAPVDHMEIDARPHEPRQVLAPIYNAPNIIRITPEELKRWTEMLPSHGDTLRMPEETR